MDPCARLLRAIFYCRWIVMKKHFAGPYNHDGSGWVVPEGAFHALNIHFEQRQYDNADCAIAVVAVDGGTGDPTDDGIWFDLLTIQDLSGAQLDYTLRQQFSCIRTVHGPLLEPAVSIKWDKPS